MSNKRLPSRSGQNPPMLGPGSQSPAANYPLQNQTHPNPSQQQNSIQPQQKIIQQQSKPSVSSNNSSNNFKNIQCRNSSGCNLQLSIAKSMINYDEPGSKFYASKICKCNARTYFLWCECGQEIIQDKPFYQGQLIKCFQAQCQRSFQIVKCPSQDCLKFDIFYDNTYQIGQPTSCRTCNIVFQQVPCNLCYESSYFQGNYIPTIPFKCATQSCENAIGLQQVNCPLDGCKQSNFFTMRNLLTPLYPTQCVACKNIFQFVPCMNCKHSVVLPLGQLEQGVQYQCKNCSQKVSIDVCLNDHLNVRTNPSITSDYGRRECTTCQSKYILLKCNKCANKKVDNPFSCIKQDKSNEQNVFKYKCKCDFESFFLTCPKCKGGYSLQETDLTQSNSVECKHCKEKVKHEMKIALEGNSSRDCKICMEKPAMFFVETCHHLFGCEDCANNLKAVAHSDTVKCPICRTYGKIGKMYI